MNLDDREKGFEAKFHADEELAFKATARRDKLLGLWVAGHIGLSGDAALDYAKSVVSADLEDSRRQVMVAKLLGDLARHNAKVGAAELHAEIDRLSHVARQQITEEIHQGRQSVSPA
jgi:hypothetical protein